MQGSGGDGHAIAGAAMGKARVLSESLGMLGSVLGVDLRQLSQNIAGTVAAKANAAEPPAEDAPH